MTWLLRVATALLFLLSASGRSEAGAPSPVADAAEKKDAAAVESLIKNGGDVKARQPDGMTALHWAARHADAVTARRLIERGADANAENRYGVRPLLLACVNGDAEIVRLLLEAGADPNAAIAGGETPLMTAARTGRIEPVQLLIARGAEVDAQEKKGQTALMWAAAEGHADVLRVLLDAKADPRRQLASGFTALFFAVRERKPTAVMTLLDAGLDVNDVLRPRSRDPKKSTTALLLAIENGHFELAAALLERGAKPDVAPAGYTGLHALTWVRKPIRGDGDPPPAGSGALNSLDMVRTLVRAGAAVDARLERGVSGRGRLTTNGATPYFLAARNSDLPLMKLLLELGADGSLTNADGTTALLACAGVGALGDGDEAAATEPETLEAAKFLVDRGADVNAVDGNGETAMHGAAYQDRPNVARFLAEHGAEVGTWNRENKWGWTPWRIAEGHRPGNFRPAPDTIAALRDLMLAGGVTPPPPKERDKQVEY